MSSPRLVLYGHFGVGNFGNDSTLEAMLYNIRKYRPSAIVTCVCTGPQVIAQRFRIEALPVDDSEVLRRQQGSNRALTRIISVAIRIAHEIKFWLSRPFWFRSIDQFIVVGTGAVDDMAVRPWNAPYALYKWCRAAKLGGTKVKFVSVGAGPIENRVSRTLMLRALRTADYRSYREVPSREYLHSVGFDSSGDSVYPDLVFSLPEKAWDPPYPSSLLPQTVGLGVIGYYGWRHDPSSGESVYQKYVAKLKSFVHWLLDQGYVVRLLIGDLRVDQRPVNELLRFVRTDGRSDWQNRISGEPIMEGHDLFQQIAKCDIVVANRFHNVLCALMMGRPVVSIGYHNKNDALMTEMGLQSCCQHIEHFSVDRLIQQFQSLTSESSLVSQRIQHRCVQYRKMLDEQYRRVLGLDAG